MKFCDLIGQLVDYISHNVHVDLVLILYAQGYAFGCDLSVIIAIVKTCLLPALVYVIFKSPKILSIPSKL